VFTEVSHRRRNPLTGDWVLVSPQRGARPWSGEQATDQDPALPEHDATCPLCPGNKRHGDASNPLYQGPFVFRNDFSALSDATLPAEEPAPPGQGRIEENDLLLEEGVTGECRVICFDHRHNRTLADLTLAELGTLLSVQQREYQDLADRFHCVTLFENKGAMMGCSQPHPHGQIWAHDHLSSLVDREDQRQRAYYDSHGSALLADYQAWESKAGERVVFANAGWLVVVPYWAAWPFETLLINRGEHTHFGALTGQDLDDLAEATAILTRCYDALFNCSFPYSMGWHNAPGGTACPHWRLHAHYFPPLLRSATVKKHMVGYEMLAEPQRDLSAEAAAAQLRPLALQAQASVAGSV